MSDSTLHLFVPSTFVVPQELPPPPPPFPGTVNPEDVRPPVDPPRPFLLPWKNHRKDEQKTNGPSIPVTIDAKELAAHNSRHDVEATLRVVFKGRENCDELVQSAIASLEDPFRGSEKSDIVWTFVRAIRPNPDREARGGGKKLVRKHKILRGPPWSIVSYGEPNGVGVRRNMIYDGDGDAIAQVDFGHSFIGIHVHALVFNNLEHTPGSSDDHCFVLESVPWPWVCIPDVRSIDRPDVGHELSVLPDTTAYDEANWIPATVPFEDFMGERAFSDEW